jgi:hypothetical protein
MVTLCIIESLCTLGLYECPLLVPIHISKASSLLMTYSVGLVPVIAALASSIVSYSPPPHYSAGQQPGLI